jgi:hypothetical protein
MPLEGRAAPTPCMVMLVVVLLVLFVRFLTRDLSVVLIVHTF